MITTVAPASVTLGVPLGIAEVWGANFSDSAQVYIDGQAASTTPMNSGILEVYLSDSVTATVGTHQFTVVQASGTSDASPFTVYTPQPAPTVMNALPSYLVGNENDPPSVVVADVNGDGFADVLVPDWTNGQIAILDGNADGSLSPAQYLSISQAYAVAVADVNGDGKADLISIGSDNHTTSTVSVLLGDGHGNFQPASSQQTVNGIYPQVVGVTDIDGDGKPDLVLCLQTALVWLKNTGGGNFAPPVILGKPIYNLIALADFNNDGKPDLLYPVTDSSTGITVLHLLLNKGGGKFTDQVAAGLNGISGIPTVIDFDLDGIPDLVVEQTILGSPTSTLYSFRGNGDGSFTQVASRPFPIPDRSTWLTWMATATPTLLR
jgi:FG-GAP-like repeat/FG-GAP repeat